MISYYDTRVYRMGDVYKVVYLKSFASDLFFDREDKIIDESPIDEKRKNNIIRAKNTVLELGLCNEWDYFVTFTIDKNKYNRYDLDLFKKDLTQWFRHRRNIYDKTEWKYLLIPELHKDGAWHMHGLIKGVPDYDLYLFEKGKHPINLVKKNYKYHQGILDKFGFNSFGEIKDKTASSFYLTKYFAKALGGGLELGKHLYFASLGLNRRELVAEGATCWPLGNTYFNDYNGVAWADAETAVKHMRALL